MSSAVKRPLNWLCVAAFAAAFWITFRVMAASVPLPGGADLEPTASEQASSPAVDVHDPALEIMISHWAQLPASTRRQ